MVSRRNIFPTTLPIKRKHGTDGRFLAFVPYFLGDRYVLHKYKSCRYKSQHKSPHISFSSLSRLPLLYSFNIDFIPHALPVSLGLSITFCISFLFSTTNGG